LPSFQLPPHVDLTPQTIRAIADRHGLDIAAGVERLPDAGIVNAIYRLGETAILRVPRNHAGCIADCCAEAIAVPAARAVGVRTPRLLAFDDSLDVLPVPYTIYQCVPGRSLEASGAAPDDAARIWREVGRDLARLHVGVAVDGAVAGLPEMFWRTDPRPMLVQRAEEGWLTSLEVGWMTAWLDRLAPAALAPLPIRLLHGDVQGSNVLVSPEPTRYEALLDWGCASLGDVACDFAGLALRAVPHLLAGHREVAAPDGDDTIEARIVWRHLQIALHMLPRGAVPGRSWAEHPLPMLLEVMRFFADPPDERWRAVGPVASTKIGGGSHA
jgi:aminoglycoside phosphotransferase (APT) family kinase protein